MISPDAAELVCTSCMWECVCVKACLCPVLAGVCVCVVTYRGCFIELQAKGVCPSWVAPPNERLRSPSLPAWRSSPERPVHITVDVCWSEQHKHNKTKQTLIRKWRKELIYSPLCTDGFSVQLIQWFTSFSGMSSLWSEKKSTHPNPQLYWINNNNNRGRDL